MAAPTITEERGRESATIANGLQAERRFTILAESGADARAKLRQIKGVFVGQVYTSHRGEVPDTAARCQAIATQPMTPPTPNGASLWRLVAQYSRTADGQAAVARPPEVGGPAAWTFTRSLRDEKVDIDAEGNPIVTPAGKPFNPPVTAPRVAEILEAEWLVQAGTTNALQLGQLQVSRPTIIEVQRAVRPLVGKVNDTTFLGAAPGSILCLAIEPAELQPGLFRFVAKFERREPQTYKGETFEGFSRLLLNLATHVVVGEDDFGAPTTSAILDSAGIPITEPVAVNADGTARVPFGEESAVEVKPHLRADLNDLGIPE